MILLAGLIGLVLLMVIGGELGRRGEAELFFDGQRVARNVKLPVSRRSRGLRVGVSGQAEIGRTYRFEVSEFQIFRRRPDGRELRKR